MPMFGLNILLDDMFDDGEEFAHGYLMLDLEQIDDSALRVL